MPLIKDRLTIAQSAGGGPAKNYRMKYVRKGDSLEVNVSCDENGDYEVDLPYGDYDVFTALPLEVDMDAETRRLNELVYKNDPDFEYVIKGELEKRRNNWQQVKPGFIHLPDEVEEAQERWLAAFDQAENESQTVGEIR